MGIQSIQRIKAKPGWNLSSSLAVLQTYTKKPFSDILNLVIFLKWLHIQALKNLRTHLRPSKVGHQWCSINKIQFHHRAMSNIHNSTCRVRAMVIPSSAIPLSTHLELVMRPHQWQRQCLTAMDRVLLNQGMEQLLQTDWFKWGMTSKPGS